jgi:hypothetical protein
VEILRVKLHVHAVTRGDLGLGARLEPEFRIQIRQRLVEKKNGGLASGIRESNGSKSGTVYDS